MGIIVCYFEVDLSIDFFFSKDSFKPVLDSVPQYKAPYFSFRLNNDNIWMPTSHYHGTGELLVEKQVIVKSGDVFPIEQASMSRFHEGGHVDFHSHATG